MPSPTQNMIHTPSQRPRRAGNAPTPCNPTANAHTVPPIPPGASMPPTQNNAATADGILSQFEALYTFINEITNREQTKVFNIKLKDKLKTDANDFRASLQAFLTQQRATDVVPPTPTPPNETTTAISTTLESYANILKRVELLVTKTRDENAHTLRNTESILAHAKSIPPSPNTNTPPSSPADLHQSHNPWQTKATRRTSSELDIVISLAKVDRKATIRTKNPTEVRSLIESALKQTDHPDLQAVTIRGTRKMSSGNILVQASTGEHAQAMKHRSALWLPHFNPKATLSVRHFPIIVNFVPTTFKANEIGAKAAIYNENQGLFPNAQAIANVRWLHQQRSDSAAKNHSSLILDITDELVADSAISLGLRIGESICPTAKYIPPPMQCFYCQSFGHLAKACPVLKDPSQLKCARCAGNHATKDCMCSSPTRCTNLRTCRHIAVKCANCAGPHKSFSNDCPAKIRAANDIASRYNTSSPYFNPEFSPRASCARRY